MSRSFIPFLKTGKQNQDNINIMQSPLSLSLTVLLCIVVILAAAVHADPDSGPVVNTQYGRVRGVRLSDANVNKFSGIPYAAPPVGSLRFEAPQDPTPWHGNTLDATLPGKACIQSFPIGNPSGTSEVQCIYIYY